MTQRLPGHRQHSLAEMQLMSQNAAQKAVGRVGVLENSINALQRRMGELERSLLGILDTIHQQQEHQGALAEAHNAAMEDLRHAIRRLDALQSPPKRKPGRPKGSKNKPKDTPKVEQKASEMGQNAPIQQPEGE